MTPAPTPPASTLERLVALSREPACGRRRQLLHDLTDPLFAAPPELRGRLEALLPLVAEELAEAEFARRARLRRQIGRDLLFRLVRDGQIVRATVCFADLTEIGYEAARGAFADPTNQLLAMICKVQHWPRDQFVTLALLRLAAQGNPPPFTGEGDREAVEGVSGGSQSERNAERFEPRTAERTPRGPGSNTAQEGGPLAVLTMAHANAAAALFDAIPMDAAERAIRFWRLRQKAAGAPNPPEAAAPDARAA